MCCYLNVQFQAQRVKLLLSSAGYHDGFLQRMCKPNMSFIPYEHFNFKFFCSLFWAVSDLAYVYFIYGSVNKFLMWNHNILEFEPELFYYWQNHTLHIYCEQFWYVSHTWLVYMSEWMIEWMFITQVKSCVAELRTTLCTTVHFASGMSFTLPEYQLVLK